MVIRRKHIIIVLILLITGFAVFGISFLISRYLAIEIKAENIDGLEWLRKEYNLSDSEYQQIKTLHLGYRENCQKMCSLIAEKKMELCEALATSTNANERIEKLVMEVNQLRAQCQFNMLRHFYEVSQSMPEEEGRRYFSKMCELTFGIHESIEREMADPKLGHRHNK